MARRNYGPGVAPALISLSQGTCYYPGCGQPVIVLVEGEPSMNLEIAHIIGLNKNSARNIESWTTDQLNAYSNLILLCHPHHKYIDSPRTRNKFSAVKLRKWKAAAEVRGVDVLNGYRFAGEDGLENVMKDVMHDQVREVKSALKEVEQLSSTAAVAIKRLVGQVNDYQLIGNYMDADQASMLNEAGRNLRRSLDPDVVAMLHSAANDLQHVNEDLVLQLEHAAKSLRQSRGDY